MLGVLCLDCGGEGGHRRRDRSELPGSGGGQYIAIGGDGQVFEAGG